MGRRQVKKRVRGRALDNRCAKCGGKKDCRWSGGRKDCSNGCTVRLTGGTFLRSALSDMRAKIVARTEASLAHAGEIKLEGVFDPTRSALLDAWADPTKRDQFRLQMPDGTRYDFRGYVTSLKDSPDGASVNIRPTGIVKERKPMPKKMQAGLKRFYVGSNNLTPDWTHAKLADAIEQARKLVTKEGYEEAFVVEIKRVVRRKEQPVVVEPFKA